MGSLLTDFRQPLPAPPLAAILPCLQQPVHTQTQQHPSLPLALMAAAAAAAAAAPPTRKRMRVAMGTTDDYEEICWLGEGGFGSVVKARHRATGRAVAIKRVAVGLGCPLPMAPMALLREASLLEACGRDNPFVVGSHGLARNPATMDLCLVMECVGPSLNDLLLQRRCSGLPPLTEAMVRAVMRQLLTGAKKMHAAHVIHRDIKPENILVGDDRNVVKICDFGLAVHMAEPPPYDPCGSLWYMAPEMLLGKTDYDALVDTWSLGCVMADLIDNGGPLFEADNEADQLRAIFDVLGAPDETTWPWFSSTPFASRSQVMPELSMKRRNLLREEFPKTKLSTEGFQVLSGLLTCNPDRRLTAAAALKHPWFARIDALQLQLPKKEEVSSALPKPKRLRVLCP